MVEISPVGRPRHVKRQVIRRPVQVDDIARRLRADQAGALGQDIAGDPVHVPIGVAEVQRFGPQPGTQRVGQERAGVRDVQQQRRGAASLIEEGNIAEISHRQSFRI